MIDAKGLFSKKLDNLLNGSCYILPYIWRNQVAIFKIFFITGLVTKDNISFLPYRGKSASVQSIQNDGKTEGIFRCLNINSSELCSFCECHSICLFLQSNIFILKPQ